MALGVVRTTRWVNTRLARVPHLRLAGVFLCAYFGVAQLAIASNSCNSLSKVEWLLGTWSSSSPKRVYQERWHKVSDATLEGESKVTSADGQSIGVESLRIVAMQGGIFYLAKVPENTLPIAFKLNSCTDSMLQFANPQHDFPQSINYRKTSEDSLSVSVTGAEGEGFTLEFTRRHSEH